jgi:16S rRNA (uracil1498-N3)-methyltransferase
MHRLYFNGEITTDSVTITDAAQLHYMRHVLRLKPGDELTLFDARGSECHCHIQTIASAEALLALESECQPGVPGIRLAIACAIPKTGMDEVINSLTQLGVDIIIPMQTERVIVRLEEARQAGRLGRWQKIAQSAAQQSQRSNLPEIYPVTPFEKVVKSAQNYGLKLIPTLDGDRKPLRELIRDTPGGILALIGPEGDFTPAEVRLAREAGFAPVSLGSCVLRVATAAVAVASYIRLALAEG